ncbi:arylacetamide deacetylase-like 4 [Elgaria multicarinata webbii]|uniref:arylacetamide deacetylase-like 4 n=1 Tax=Elgaria multicarinata webbii TaxID=159646 RepID=UPI002FCCE912
MKHAEDYGVDPDRIIISGDSFGGLLAASVCQMIAQRDDVPKLCSQMLIYPFLQVVKYSLPSYMQNAYAPPLTRRQAVKFALQYMQIDRGFEDLFLEGLLIPSDMKMKYRKLLSADNIPEEFKVRETKARKYTAPFADMQELIDHLYGPLLSPLLVEDAIIRQLPQTFILTGQYDVLRDDGILYKKRLEDNDVPVSWHHFEDGFHGSLFYINHWIANFSCCEEGMDSIVNYIRGL